MVTPLLLIEQMILSIGLFNKEKVLSKLEYLGELRARYADKLPRGRREEGVNSVGNGGK